MDKRLKAKWVEALRSGKWKQGTGYMQSGDSYCCLGVLRELRGCDDVFDAVGSAGAELIAMNDGKNGHRQHSFSEIADYIEQNL